MRILVLGATGDVGSKVVHEALARDHDLTAVARDKNRLATLPDRAAKRVLDLASENGDLARLAVAHDAVISALRPPSGQEATLVPLTRQVLGAAEAAGVPVVVVGGAARLRIREGCTQTVLTAPGFLPESVRPIAEACAAQDRMLDQHRGARWTYLCPPAMLTDAQRRGRYRSGTDTLVTDDQGLSRISYADFAMALVDLVEMTPAPHQRLTVAW